MSTKWHSRRIVAWDGEGANLPTCVHCKGPIIQLDKNRWEHVEKVIPHDAVPIHIYNLLSNSFGQYITNPLGLSTEEVLNFFFEFSTVDNINVIYGGSYDVNMFLGDMPEDKIRKLWKYGSVYWKNYGISYISRKQFGVALYPPEFPQIKCKPIKRFTLWDVIGYYQKTFVKACEYWLGNDMFDINDLYQEIQQMKQKRSTFTSTTLQDIIRYNFYENQLLVLLVIKLFESLDVVEVILNRYDGAGSIAGALLRKHNIIAHKGVIPQDVSRWAQYSYSGGRIEAIKIGNSDQPVYRYDINSAYPYQACLLPSFAGATFQKTNRWQGTPYSIVEVKFHYQQEAPFYPLWVRWPDGSILYPRYGQGRYYGYECLLLRDYFVEGVDYEIVSCYTPQIVLFGSTGLPSKSTHSSPFLFLAVATNVPLF